MATALVLWHGRRLAIVPEPPERPTFVRVVGDAQAVALQAIGDGRLVLAAGDRASFERARSSSWLTASPTLRRQLLELGVASGEAPAMLARRAALRLEAAPMEREARLTTARAALTRAQRDPTETLIALSREEERLERALGREVNAQEELLAGWGQANPLLADDVRRFREAFSRHHDRIEHELERQVSAVAPNLAAVTGSKVAARLIAAANGLQPLARMPAGRLQLLGARRRPAQGPGPRHGLIFRALGMDSVPWGRQGAYARTLAAGAVIAARMDLAGAKAGTATRLVSRMERRRQALRRRRS